MTANVEVRGKLDFPSSPGIYALLCPLSGCVCYVGKSKNVKRRLSQHCYQTHACGLCEQWIKKLWDEHNLSPVKMVLELTEKESLDERETYWINFFVARNQCNMNSDKVRRAESRSLTEFRENVKWMIKCKHDPCRIEKWFDEQREWNGREFAYGQIIDELYTAFIYDQEYLIRVIEQKEVAERSPEIRRTIKKAVETLAAMNIREPALVLYKVKRSCVSSRP